MNSYTVTWMQDGSLQETRSMTAGDAYSMCDRLRASGHTDATVLTYL